MPTCSRAIPRSRPPVCPAGIDRLQQHELDRYIADKHRFPPHTYQDCYCFTDPSGQVEVADADMREILHWILQGHSVGRWKTKSEKASPTAMEDFRCSAVGNVFHVGVVGVLLAVRYLRRSKPELVEVHAEKTKYFWHCPRADKYF